MDTLSLKDPPDLAAPNPVPPRLGSDGERVQGPLCGSSFVRRCQGAIALTHRSTRWRQGDKRQDRAPFGFRQAALPSSPRPISEAVQAFGIESSKALTHSLGMTLEFGGDRRGAQTRPTAQDDAGAEDPISRGMATARQPLNLGVFA